MKKNIHPNYFSDTIARCSCGSIYKIGSTKEVLEVEICANCHPFYTGKEKNIDKGGQVQKFRERLSKKRK